MPDGSLETINHYVFMNIKPAENKSGVAVKPELKETGLPSNEELRSVLPAFKLKKILVPVDFSECTKESLLYAVPFAKQFDARLTLLHVMEPTYLAPSETSALPITETVEAATKRLKQLRDRCAGTVQCQTLVRLGYCEHEIIKVAQEEGSDLIILSTHGRTGLARLVMGSTAERVVRRAGCPLLIVRPNEHEFVTPDLGMEKNELEAVDKFQAAAMEAEMVAGM